MYLQCMVSCHKDCQMQPGILLFQHFLIIFPQKRNLFHLKATKSFHIEACNASQSTFPVGVQVALYSEAQLSVPTTDAIVMIKLYANWALCFEVMEPVFGGLSVPLLHLEDNDNWLGLVCRVQDYGHSSATFDSRLACRPGPNCWLLAPRPSPSQSHATASVFAVDGDALGPLIGGCAVAGHVCPLLLPVARLAHLLGVVAPSPMALMPRSQMPSAAPDGPACLLEVGEPGAVVWGAATALGPRLMVTCAHLVATATAAGVRLRAPDGGWRRARILWANQLAASQPVFDAAFLELEAGQPDLPRFAATPAGEPPVDAARSGQRVTAIGFPFQGMSRPCPMLSQGSIVHVFGGLLPDEQCLTVAYQTSCPVFNGFSGGPLLLADGNLIAMTVGHLRLHSPDKNCHDVSLSIPMHLLQAAAEMYNKTKDTEVAFGHLSVPLSVHRGWIWHAANGLLVQHNPCIRAKL